MRRIAVRIGRLAIVCVAIAGVAEGRAPGFARPQGLGDRFMDFMSIW